MKKSSPASTHKKVVVQLSDRKSLRGYLNPASLNNGDAIDLLTPDGAHESLSLARVRSIYFVREFGEPFEPARKAFLSRPKLDGLWVKLRYTDDEVLEGVVPNDLLALMRNGVQITPPDLSANTDRIFIPRSAMAELTVLGVTGVARRKPAPLPPQPRLFNE